MKYKYDKSTNTLKQLPEMREPNIENFYKSDMNGNGWYDYSSYGREAAKYRTHVANRKSYPCSGEGWEDGKEYEEGEVEIDVNYYATNWCDNEIFIALKHKTMKNGIELIAQERQEQIEKHGITLNYDFANNSFRQLSEAAMILLEDPNHLLYDGDTDRTFAPSGWNLEVFNKMRSKSYMERLIIAGALIAAEIDRLQGEEL